MATEPDMGRAFINLSKAIDSMCTDTNDLRTRWQNAVKGNIGGTRKEDFPDGALQYQYEEVAEFFAKAPATEEDAKILIKKLVALRDDLDAEIPW